MAYDLATIWFIGSLIAQAGILIHAGAHQATWGYINTDALPVYVVLGFLWPATLVIAILGALLMSLFSVGYLGAKLFLLIFNKKG